MEQRPAYLSGHNPPPMRRPDHRWAAAVSSSQLFTKHLGDSGYFRMYFIRTSLVVQWLRL